MGPHVVLKADYARQGVGVWKNGDDICLTQMFLPRSVVPDVPEKRAANLIKAVNGRLPI